MRRFVIRLVLAVLVVGLPAFVAAQSGTVTPSPFQVVLDSNGAPVSGALIYTYTAGTTARRRDLHDVGPGRGERKPDRR